MQPEQWRRAKEAFEAVADLDPDQARAHLDGTAPDAEVRAEVESLLAAHREAGRFLENPPAVDPDLLTATWDPLVGAQLGPYRVSGEFARGGMGTVYLAARADAEFEKRVAIKVLQAGLTGASVLERFRKERQILANLDHPHIARLLDAGTTPDGRPYLVMEFVDGLRIDEYCQQAAVSLPDRIRLFIAVAKAVHYAHQHLVIHRDIKPSNVLVTAQGEPRLMDFGIAKILDTSDTAGQPITVDVLPMTPRYASPEQIRGEVMTTATDVYSLGVLLYELLTGQSPYPVETGQVLAWSEAIVQREPTAPSAVVRERSQGAPRARDLSGSLRGDLDTIVLKAIQKDGRRRYASALDLAHDLENYLDGRPVTARPDSMSYRLGKFVRRHPAGVGFAAAGAALLIGAFAVTAWQYGVAERERGRAERRFGDVRQLAQTFMFDIHDAIRDLPGSTAARQRLVETALEYLGRLSQDVEDDRDLQRELAAAYERVAVIQGMPGTANVGWLGQALENQRKASSLREARSRSAPGDVEAKHEWAMNLSGLAQMLSSSDSAGALAAAEQAVGLVAEEPPAPASVRSQVVRATAYYALGSASVGAGRIDEGVQAFTRNAEILGELLRVDPSDAWMRRDFALTNKRLGALLGMNGRTTEAFERYHQALATEEAALKVSPLNAEVRRDISVTYSDLGWLLNRTGDRKAAIESYRKAFEIRKTLSAADPANRDMAWMLSSTLLQLGNNLGEEKDWNEARAMLLEAAAIRERLSNPDSRNLASAAGVASVYRSLGSLAFAAGNYEEAVTHHTKALALIRDIAGRDPANRSYRIDLGVFSGNVGESYRKLAAVRTSVPDRCRMLIDAERHLDEAVTVLRGPGGDWKLFGAEAQSLDFVAGSLRTVGTDLAGLRASGACPAAPSRPPAPSLPPAG